jgi:hypothetical protein
MALRDQHSVRVRSDGTSLPIAEPVGTKLVASPLDVDQRKARRISFGCSYQSQPHGPALSQNIDVQSTVLAQLPGPTWFEEDPRF